MKEIVSLFQRNPLILVSDPVQARKECSRGTLDLGPWEGGYGVLGWPEKGLFLVSDRATRLKGTKMGPGTQAPFQ